MDQYIRDSGRTQVVGFQHIFLPDIVTQLETTFVTGLLDYGLELSPPKPKIFAEILIDVVQGFLRCWHFLMLDYKKKIVGKPHFTFRIQGFHIQGLVRKGLETLGGKSVVVC